MDFNEELDACGLVCPMPALKTKKKLQKMNNGDILKVIIDYAPAKDSVPRDLAKGKHEFLGLEEDEDEEQWYLYFKVVK